MPVCHRFKNFQPQGLELRQLQFKQTQRRLHPQWHQIELHCKNTPRSGEKKNQFFSLSSLMFENYKNAILLQHWTIARSPSWKQTNSSTNVFPQPSFSKGGESTTAHLQQNTTKKKKSKEFPSVPSPETQKLNQSIQHYNRAILLSQSRREPVERAVGHSDRSGAGDRGWAMGTFH